uniref:Uncharacterized protein n=1 Tax=Rhizophora mucronata TaxID=61149 RepID=A0A2P2PKE2_RHIMU
METGEGGKGKIVGTGCIH